MKTIKEIALDKKKEYDEEYIQWCRENPGRIMNGLSSKSIGADIAQYCDTKEDLETFIKVYNRKAANTEGVHGHYFIVQAFKDILQELNLL